MKRALAEQAIRYARELLKKHCISLPEFGHGDMGAWKVHRDELDFI